jgi:hypothetical protein
LRKIKTNINKKGVESVRIKLPTDVRMIIDRFEKNGFSAYAVGGCVRDSLLQKEPNDWDICTDALPQNILRLFSDFHTFDTGISIMFGYDQHTKHHNKTLWRHTTCAMTNIDPTPLCYTLGGALTVYGLFNLITYFTSKQASFGFEMIVGIAATAFGVFFLISPQSILGMIFAIIGILIIVDSTIDIKRSFQLKSLGVKYWWISFVVSALIIIFAITTIIFPGFFADIIMIILGIALVIIL